MGAIGSVLYLQKNAGDYIPFKGIEALEKFLAIYRNFKKVEYKTFKGSGTETE